MISTIGICAACGYAGPPSEASEPERERCPTCGSDNPRFCQYETAQGYSHLHGMVGGKDCCPDPFHNPSAPEVAAPSDDVTAQDAEVEASTERSPRQSELDRECSDPSPPEAEQENFEGFAERECGEHRTLGGRAWCHTCTTYCYPNDPCPGCELPALRERLERAERKRDEAEQRAEHWSKANRGALKLYQDAKRERDEARAELVQVKAERDRYREAISDLQAFRGDLAEDIKNAKREGKRARARAWEQSLVCVDGILRSALSGEEDE